MSIKSLRLVAFCVLLLDSWIEDRKQEYLNI
jgi:hypothetical protein